ncbi:LysR substrate-binding domain-containing protein [Microvirga yunnanensis]|uniref:LysR substrate-binding domain-containing protein n=1 Tax=Microvirga yunnanensis TaxID=2953740 RepID=UPI0021C83275|nr:LysR substrate-binding domain-containing protein [Microvirga sp. HBU65207]
MRFGYTPSMNLTLIETFSAVMKTGSTTKAAAILGISQPAVSRAMRRLEDTTRLKLFERSGPKLTPTPEAKLLYQEILDIHVGLDRLKQAVVRIRDVGSGSLKIASSAALGLTFLPKVIEGFLQRHPNVVIKFEIASSATVRSLIVSGAYDIGLCADEVDRSNLVAEPFVSSRGVCVMRQDHPLSSQTTIAPTDLDGTAFVALSPEDTARQAFDRVLAEAGVRPRILIETPFSATVCQFALEGVGVGLANPVTFLSEGYAQRGLVARPFEPPVWFKTILILPPQRVRSRLVDELIVEMNQYREKLLGRAGV